MDGLSDIAKKLFPLRGKKLDEKLQAMFDDAVKAEAHDRPKHALDQLSAIWEESVHSPTWKHRRQFELIPLIAKLSEHHDAARFKLRSMRDAQEKLMRQGNDDFALIGEWIALNRLVEPERTIFVYDELKKKFDDYSVPVLTRIRIVEVDAFLEQGRYGEFLEEDLETLFEYLEDDASDLTDLAADACGDDDTDDTDDTGDTDDAGADNADDGSDFDRQDYERALKDTQAGATRLVQLALLKGCLDYVDEVQSLLTDSLADKTNAYFCLIRGAEKAKQQTWIDKFVNEAKEALSPLEFAELTRRRTAVTPQ